MLGLSGAKGEGRRGGARRNDNKHRRLRASVFVLCSYPHLAISNALSGVAFLSCDSRKHFELNLVKIQALPYVRPRALLPGGIKE